MYQYNLEQRLDRQQGWLRFTFHLSKLPLAHKQYSFCHSLTIQYKFACKISRGKMCFHCNSTRWCLYFIKLKKKFMTYTSLSKGKETENTYHGFVLSSQTCTHTLTPHMCMLKNKGEGHSSGISMHAHRNKTEP